MDSQRAIEGIAQKCQIALVYIFGSQVEAALDLLQGKGRQLNDPLTDIDTGVVFESELPGPLERYELYSFIQNSLEDLLSPFPVDLVFLQETHSVFQSRAICGECVYCRSLDFRECYEENVIRRAADFRPFLERYLDDALEGVLKDAR